MLTWPLRARTRRICNFINDAKCLYNHCMSFCMSCMWLHIVCVTVCNVCKILDVICDFNSRSLLVFIVFLFLNISYWIGWHSTQRMLIHFKRILNRSTISIVSSILFPIVFNLTHANQNKNLFEFIEFLFH